MKYLEDVLFAIDDSETTNLIDGSDITGVQPALTVNGITRVLFVLVVSVNDVASTETYLATGVRQVS
jgi:hypothetical protein